MLNLRYDRTSNTSVSLLTTFAGIRIDRPLEESIYTGGGAKQASLIVRRYSYQKQSHSLSDSPINSNSNSRSTWSIRPGAV